MIDGEGDWGREGKGRGKGQRIPVVRGKGESHG